MTLLIVVFVLVVGAVWVLADQALQRRYRDRKPALEEQRRKVDELVLYSGKLRKKCIEASGARQVILARYLEVAQKKLVQETEKLEAMRVEAEREEFERMMEK